MGVLKNLFKTFGGREQTKPQMQEKDPYFNEELASYVNKEYQRRQAERRLFELQWRLNSEFLNGNQYLDINTVTQTLEEIPRLFWYQEREVFNQIATIVETRISKLSRSKPLMKVRPASSDDKDVSTAKVTTMLLGSSWSDQDMDDKYEDFVSWLELCGTAFWKTSWNPRSGRLIYRGLQPDNSEDLKLDDEPELDPMTEQMLGKNEQMVEIREGDIDTTVVPAHEIFPDSPWRGSMREVRSIIHARAYHISEIEDIWGVQVEPEEVDVMTLQRATTGLGGIGYTYGSIKTGIAKLDNHAVVKEYYEKPSKRYPQGRFIVVAGNQTIHIGPMPYQIGKDGQVEFPIVRVVSIDRPGCFFGKTVLERCIPIQRRYNALRNRKAEYLNLVTIGQWKAPLNSVDDDTVLNNAPGNIVWYRPGVNGLGPEPVQWPNLPSSFEKEEDTLLAEFTAVSGVSELARYAEAPSGVKSGVALGIAKEQDDTRMATSTARLANGVVSLGKYWIRLWKQFVQEPRVLRHIGENRNVDVREWMSSDLKSDDVFIENMAALSETPAQRRQMVFDLLGAGLFNRPEMSNLTEEGRRKVFQLLEFGHWETGSEDDYNLQVSRARSESRDIMSGVPKPVMDFDDHHLHIQQHNRMRMQTEYEELMKTPLGPMVNELMMQHISEHILRAMESMGQQAQPQEVVEE